MAKPSPLSLDLLSPELRREIDPLILSIVDLLNSRGYVTTASCQGGKGHGFSLPMVNIEMPAEFFVRSPRRDLAKLLTDSGLTGFYIKQISSYQSDPEEWGRDFAQIEFWAPIEQLLADSKLDVHSAITDATIRKTK